MRILLLLPALNLGGVETGTIDLACILKKMGNDVLVVSSGGKLVGELEKIGVKHIPLPVHKKNLFWAVYSLFELKEIIKEQKIEIVHAQSRMPAWIAYFACLRSNAVFITSCHGYYSKHLFSRVMGWGRRVIVISVAIAERMKGVFGVDDKKIRLVYRGVDLNKYNYSSLKYDVVPERFKIINVARITPIKGQIDFIHAISMVEKEIPNLEVWLVGGAAKNKIYYYKKLQHLVKKLHLEDKVKFLGSRSDIPKLLEQADLLVLSTRVPEAFGRVIIEAGAVGTVVCAPRTGGISEIIEHGKDGVLFKCRDRKSMAEAITFILKKPQLCKDFSRNLYQKVQERFNLERMVKGTLAVYQEALEDKKILVIKLGALGDVILIVPALRELRKKFPRAWISLLVECNYEKIMRNCPYVNEIITFDRKRDNFFQLKKKLSKRYFDISIDFKNNAMTHALAYFSGIKQRYGFNKWGFSVLLNKRQDFSKVLFKQPVNQQFELLKSLGVECSDERLELWPDRKDEVYVESILREYEVKTADKLVGLSLGASKNWPTKEWPIGRFVSLGEKLVQNGFKIVLLGDSHSIVKAKSFIDNKNIINLVGRTDLGQLTALIKNLNVLVSPDSAPLHIASAVRIPVVALFGPTDPKRHLPSLKNIEVLAKDEKCRPCYSRRCINKDGLVCLENISVDEVFQKVIQQCGVQNANKG